MDGDTSDERPYRDTLKVPSVLVLPGDPWPAEFYSRYPEAFRLPVRLVWREGASGRTAGTTAARGRGGRTA